jgi:urease accessory protein
MSVRVEKIEGNVKRDEKFRQLYDEHLSAGRVDRVILTRREASKIRIRTTSEGGIDVMIDVPRGTTIRHGDVLSLERDRMLIAEWSPEEAMIIAIETSGDCKELVETATRLGYILGMKHFPLFVEGNEILVPVEGADDDVARQLGTLAGISVRREKRILERPREVAGHEHQV